MLQLGPTPAELQYVQQAEARRQSNADQLAAAWAGSVSPAANTIASVTANPMPIEFLGNGIDMVGPPPSARMSTQGDQQSRPASMSQENGQEGWGEAGRGALKHGTRGAAAGSAFGPWGALIGGVAGTVIGGTMGYFGVEDDYGDEVSAVLSLGKYEANWADADGKPLFGD